MIGKLALIHFLVIVDPTPFNSRAKELPTLVVGQHSFHFLVVGQVLQYVASLGSLQIAMALVAVQVTMAHGVVLEGPIAKATYHEEALLSRLLRLQLILLDFALAEGFGTHAAHFQAERCLLHWC